MNLNEDDLDRKIYLEIDTKYWVKGEWFTVYPSGYYKVSVTKLEDGRHSIMVTQAKDTE